MKVLVFSLVFLLTSNIALAQVDSTSSNTVWIDTNSVLISHPQNPEIARRDCDTTMHILSIMSNDRIVFRSRCERTYNPRCVYYYCYQLSVKALVIDHRRVEQEP